MAPPPQLNHHHHPPPPPPPRPNPPTTTTHHPVHPTARKPSPTAATTPTAEAEPSPSAAITLLTLLLIAAIGGCALYVLYRPLRPDFSIPSLRLNLTADDHVTTLLNLTVVSKNPNSHIAFSYDPFTLACSTSSAGILLGNASIPGFVQDKKNVTTLRNVVVSGSYDLDSDSVNALKSDLKRRNGNGSNGNVVLLKILLDTKVTVTVGKVKSKRVGIRVTCDSIRGTVMNGKSRAVTVTSGSNNKCTVDLRIKIWNFTF